MRNKAEFAPPVMTFIKRYSWPLCIFCAALALRIVYLLQVRGTPVTDFLVCDSKYYHEWASAIAAGDWLGGQRIFYAGPLYAYFLALIYAVAGPTFFAALFVQSLIGSATCALAYFAGRKFFNERAAVAAGLLCAVYPVFIYYDGTLLKESLMAFVTLLFVVCYPAGDPGARPRTLVASGALLGLHALMRANVVLLLPLLFAWEWSSMRRRAVARFALLLLGAAAVTAPVAVRNKVVGGEWVVSVSEGGMNFWAGNNPEANGAQLYAPFLTSEEPQYEDEDFRREASRRAGRELNVKEASDYWYRQGIDFIVNDPGRWAWLLWRKTLAWMTSVELPDDLNFYFVRDFSSLIRFDRLSFGMIAPLGAAGLAAAWKFFPISRFPALIIVSNLLSGLVFFNLSRYRLPVVPLFILFASFFIFWFLNEVVRRRRARRIAGWAVALIALFGVCNYQDPVFRRIARTRVNYLNASVSYVDTGRLAAAERMVLRSLELDPAYALAWAQYADVLERMGRDEEAGSAFNKALDYGKDDPRFLRLMNRVR